MSRHFFPRSSPIALSVLAITTATAQDEAVVVRQCESTGWP